MEVAQEFRAHGLRVDQSAFYADPNTKEPREIDGEVMFAKHHREMNIFLTCYVECKVSLGRPWVLFTVPPNAYQASGNHHQMIASVLGKELLYALAQEGLGNLPRLLQPRERIAYGVTQGLRKGGDNLDIAYQAVMSAAKAAVARGTVIKTVFEQEPWDEPFVELVLPVVVIDGDLYEYFLDEEEEKRLRQIPSGLLNFRNPIPGHDQATLVYIVTKQGLPEFASSIAGLTQHWVAGAGNYYDRLIQRFARYREQRRLSGPVPTLSFLSQSGPY